MILIVGGSYQGKTEFARNEFPEAKYFNQLHLFVKKRISEGKNNSEILAEIREVVNDGEWVIISDEIGNGIVPLDENDRTWREICGRIMIELAKDATEVYRVVCGIGQRIK
ncbi:bifunctional adenosylcobinamide kinase/adenosylcobinamide-phosphate guanylyltransferase [Pseudobutyrivibrio xylanivorans]|uniref:Adenosylcobinamide kinase /adenosylcobinamide-phosphate guanylyltransferase n=1 Tax=Pseudobutyrivibrio xylanivorans DSM 14809 TaxID=1123012 RepID=A0A1M6CE52_PSEXY|nr:bifunctional adenosylcobinamide kinase/adenosylcobinamide-phosphate guanylyltransferase [Pseudobutyrivibrio xylanivorans]SHI59309.1 adenosylcobinamide kinase /adenosylcobinamide-phosphate guanylyltransferase [Pseudobutyrivibrio xylanivorans DSM 14809]